MESLCAAIFIAAGFDLRGQYVLGLWRGAQGIPATLVNVNWNAVKIDLSRSIQAERTATRAPYLASRSKKPVDLVLSSRGRNW